MNNNKPQSINELLNSNNTIEKLKFKIINEPHVCQLIKNLNLNDRQIDKNLNILHQYYAYVIENNKEPDWKIYLDQYGFLSIDHSNEKWFELAKKRNNIWMTNITQIDYDFQRFFAGEYSYSMVMNKIYKSFANSMEQYAGVQNDIAKIQKKNDCINLYLIDASMNYSYVVFKYLAFTLINNNKTVAILDIDDIYREVSRNYDSGSSILKLMEQVDYLFIINIGLSSKPEWFMQQYLIKILNIRYRRNKPTFLSSTEDIRTGKHEQLISSKYNLTKKFLKSEIILVNFIESNFKIY
ncbi:hypothetical protein [Mycoplasma phocoenae]|uniref:Uncharacterized protein n=1 Tax=Mycoplasma phocoenae TaxID=754517 RepID=A0A858U905_9MOLU|nr:hypothetical protein [Mycoplasma phocoenae]QJG67198.1 hypothetical protein HGG69_02695 [Mycoplasma phocoenae]